MSSETREHEGPSLGMTVSSVGAGAPPGLLLDELSEDVLEFAAAFVVVVLELERDADVVRVALHGVEFVLEV
eukprot:CAMPEP_0185696632 /NCGR_PEP_ID=MMETSP1164-20130828/5253_1 /TAXON_ID=1104430 /ORGANISM="Chrysoreinhardia sp, Strain CCMP2950" /LENGTH=71 /DNA_ID=CAMNT_0028363511 /DNA_START=74 /DNA_END=287 /DNA_ORIENTATION=-